MNFLIKPINFFKEVKVQLIKVSWPTRAELIGATTVVIVAILICAIFVGLIDTALSRLISLLFK